MSFMSASRSVLLLSDDGISVYAVRSGVAEYIDTLLWDADKFEFGLSALIRNRCGGKPVVIINDMVEQHYRKEKIPKVSPIDKANLIKRRVANAFPSYPMRSYIKLKEKAPSVEGQAAGEVYLFSAVPMTDNIRKTLAGVQRSGASISGFCLLPVEATSMVHALGKKLSKNSSEDSAWSIFVGQHQSGGLRQIVTKNGELALTRMTPISNGIDDDSWCDDVVGELRGTMSYLSRFGFSPEDGLNVIIIAPNAVSAKLSSSIDFDCNLNILTPYEASKLSGVKISTRGNDQQRYADILHVSSIAKKSSFLMPLKATQIETVNKPIQMATATSVALLLGVGYMGYLSVSSVAKIVDYEGQIKQETGNLSTIQTEYESEMKKKKVTGVDYMLVQSVTKVYGELEKESMKPLPLIALIGRSIGPDLHISSMEVKPVLKDLNAEVAPAVDPNTGMPLETPAEGDALQTFEIVVKIVFPPDFNPDLGVQKVGEVVDRLKVNLPHHLIRVIKQVADLSYTGNFVGESTTSKNDSDKKEYEAQILIRGAMI